MLKMIKIKLGLNPDPDIFEFFKKHLRSVISYISNRSRKPTINI